MDAVLANALAPVMRDIEATGVPAPDRIAMVADQVQEWVIEALWATAPTNWPPCPDHPGTHPLSANVANGAAVWTCPKDGSSFVAIGALV